MSGYQVSPFGDPNILYKGVSGAGVLENRRNDLLNQSTQQAIGAGDTEMVARLAQSLVNMPEEEAAKAYGPGIAYLQQQGFAKHAPAVYPGHAVAQRLAALAVPAKDQYDRQGVATDAAGVNLGSRGPGGGGGGGGEAAPLTPFVARNLPPGITPEEDLLVRTASGEAADQGPVGQQAVAAVIRNRARESGRSVSDVIFAANQFEPWNNPATRAKLEAMDPNSPQYQAILANLRANQADPTGGATHFYSPRAQQELGRQPPSWSNTEPSKVIGGHNFYRIGYRPGGGAPASPGQPQTPPGGSTPPPGVQMGGAPPAPPGGVPGAYGGGGFGTALNPTPPVATTPPASGGGTASNVPGNVGAIQAGMAQARYTPTAGVQTAGPGAPTTGTQVASVEPPPQPGWGTAVGSYGDGAAAPPASAQQPATRQQPPPPPPASRPAEMPAELRTNEAYLTPSDVAEFDSRRKNLRDKGQYQQWLNDLEQRKATNERRQKEWQAQEHQRQTDAAATRREQREIDAANQPEQSKGQEADDLRVLQKFGPLVRAGKELTPEQADQYDLHRRSYAEGPERDVPDGRGGTIRARMGREISDRFPPLPGQKEYAGLKPIPGTERPPEMAPPAIVGGMLANATGMAKVLKAQQALDEYSSAVGLKGNLPELILQRGDAEGVGARTAISDVGGHEFHDMSGAAITQSEGRRLTYIPTTQDTERAVKTKLQNLLENNREILLKGYRTYGPENNGRRLPEVEAAIVESIPEVARDALKTDKDPQAAKKFDRVFGRGAAKLALNYDG